jgi:hypothetical protein
MKHRKKHTHPSSWGTKTTHKKYFLFFFLFLFLILTAPFAVYKKEIIRKFTSLRPGNRQMNVTERFSSGELFVLDVRNSVNTLKTKANGYDFISSYVNNGGNIYEVYDFIDSHSELSFLKEAESIYPEVFKQITRRRLPFTYSDRGMYAYLAYLETLERHGYGGITTLGPLSHQYIKMAYYMKMIIEDKSNGRSLNYPDYKQEDIKSNMEKAARFALLGEGEVRNILREEFLSGNVASVPALVGLVQYAVALRYFGIMDRDVIVSSDQTSRDIFSFAREYAKRGGFPEIYLPVHLSDAVSLLLLPEKKREEMKTALLPFLATEKAHEKSGFIRKVLDARFDIPVSRFRDLDIYSNQNIKNLGLEVPEFRAWLLSNGWTESDFK